MAERISKISPKLSTKPYKGTRDFFPEQMRVRKWAFDKLAKTVELFGYEPYDGPMLESLELYAAKSGEEIVREQLYSFQDKAGRNVAMRPEMTPTVARMVSQKLRELVKPIRWYSIPNLWRYENPQKGRLREHWQLNVDMFGVESINGDVELVIIAIDLLKAFGANQSMFQLKYNHRGLLDSFAKNYLAIDDEIYQKLGKAIDKKAKIGIDQYQSLLRDLGFSLEKIDLLDSFLSASLVDIDRLYPELSPISQQMQNFVQVLQDLGYGGYIHYAPEIVRGFDYYTGLVFEVYDNSQQNRRSIYGGGRYDNLTQIFGTQRLPGIGFGLGDVTLFDFLETHSLLSDARVENKVMIALLSDSPLAKIWQMAAELRQAGLTVEIPWDVDKLGKQFRTAEKKSIKYVILLGGEEANQNQVSVKNLENGQQKIVEREELVTFLKNSSS